jgi:hypothetical protein
MHLIQGQSFGGERPLFGLQDTRLENVTIMEGESGIKCCRNIEMENCHFIGKYPLWHVDKSIVSNCHFEVSARSAIWYSDMMTMRNSVIDAPKFFREMKDLSLEQVLINDADETFWNIDGLRLKDVTMHQGTYPFMNSRNIYVDGLKCDSLYVFQYCKEVEIHHAEIVTKDSFWECENVTIYDSVIDGEYLAWHSKNVRLVNCHIGGEQPLCYAEGLILENCTFDEKCDRAFEDSDVQADIRGKITEIKNPRSGRIIADEIGKITYDEFAKEPHNCEILLRKS